MAAMADGRGYSWEDQRADLVSRAEEATTEQRAAMKGATSVCEALEALPESVGATPGPSGAVVEGGQTV